MFAFLATLSFSQKYIIYAIDKKGLEIPFVSFNLDETTRYISPERLVAESFPPGNFDYFEIKNSDGSSIRTRAPYHTNSVNMRLTVSKHHIPMALEIKSSSGRKRTDVSISMNSPRAFQAPHAPVVRQQEGGGGGMSPLLMLPLFFVFMRMCMGGMGAPAPAA